ncbi:MAG: class I SAM-dependent methyltransferase [Methylococcaceae bacterium]
MQKQAYLEMYQYEDNHWWFVARRHILEKLLNSFFKQTNANILELGCGTGGNFQLLAQYGNLYAMEFDNDACDMAKTRGIGTVIQGVLPEPIAFKENFDLICMLDVLEHIDDELATLQQVHLKLNEKGILLITVPAYMFLWSSHDEAVNHKRRYLKSQLVKLLENAGFKINYASYFNSFLFPVIATVRFLNKLLAKKEGTDVSMPSAIVNNCLLNIFAFERYLMPKFSLAFGVSIVVVAEKSN